MPRGRRPRDPPTSYGESPPALSPQARENQVIAAAYDLAEKQIREGTASAMVITHFLRLGSQKERLERELLSERTRLTSAKVVQIDRASEQDEMYEQAVEAMRSYRMPLNGEDFDDY